MNVQYVFRQMDPSPALRQFTQEKLEEKLRAICGEPLHGHVTFRIDAGEPCVTADFEAPGGLRLMATENHPDMYGAVEGLTDKLRRQLADGKEIRRTRRAVAHFAPAPEAVAAGDADEALFDDEWEA